MPHALRRLNHAPLPLSGWSAARVRIVLESWRRVTTVRLAGDLRNAPERHSLDACEGLSAM